MKNKMIIIVAFACTILGVIYFGRNIKELNRIDFTYEFNDNGVTVTQYKGSDKDIKIPSFFWFWKVTKISNIGYPDAESVYIPDTVTYVEEALFKDYVNLTSVRLSENCTRVSDWMFDNCNKLVSINIPDNVTCIGAYAFRDCTSLKTVKFSDQIWYIQQFAFMNCTSLDNVVLPNGLEEAGICIFEGCTGLRSVTLSESCSIITSGMFLNCSSLESLYIPDCVTAVLYLDAFKGCTSLKSIKGGKNLCGYDWGQAKEYFADAPWYQEEFAMFGDYTLARYNGNEKEVVIPDGVKIIWATAFDGLDIDKVVIPDSVEVIFGIWEYQEEIELQFSDLGSVSIKNGDLEGVKALVRRGSSLDEYATQQAAPENNVYGKSVFLGFKYFDDVVVK